MGNSSLGLFDILAHFTDFPDFPDTNLAQGANSSGWLSSCMIWSRNKCLDLVIDFALFSIIASIGRSPLLFFLIKGFILKVLFSSRAMCTGDSGFQMSFRQQGLNGVWHRSAFCQGRTQF